MKAQLICQNTLMKSSVKSCSTTPTSIQRDARGTKLSSRDISDI
jgi:hypothetical protein